MGSVDFFFSHPVFTLEEYAQFRAEKGSAHPRTIETLLSEHMKAGRILRIRRGLYASVPPGGDVEKSTVNMYLLATHLTPDAFVAYHAALQYWGKAYSAWDSVQFATSSRRRSFLFQRTRYEAVQVPLAIRNREDLGGGILTQSLEKGMVRVASFERTLVDLMDAPERGGGWEEIWRSLDMVEFFNLNEVVRITLDRSSALTTARVGFYLERHQSRLMVEDRHLAPLRERIPKQPQYLDRHREPGHLVKVWNLIVPEQVLNQEWAEVL